MCLRTEMSQVKGLGASQGTAILGVFWKTSHLSFPFSLWEQTLRFPIFRFQGLEIMPEKQRPRCPECTVSASSGTFSTYLHATKMSYKIWNQLGMADLMVQKGFIKILPALKKQKQEKMHVNIASKSLENSGVFILSVQWFAVLSVQRFFFFFFGGGLKPFFY